MLFRDDFSSYEVARTMIKVPYRDELALGPWRLYSLHYAWTSPRFANWTVTGFPWAVGEEDGLRFLEMPDALDNVVLAAGDGDWGDYTLKVSVAWMGEGTVGALFRYRTSRHHYRLDFVSGAKLRVVRREDADEVTIAERDFPHRAGAWHRVEIGLEGSRFRVKVQGRLLFDLEDDRYPLGRIGLRADGKGRFAEVQVTAGRAEHGQARLRKRQRAASVRERAKSRQKAAHKWSVTLPRDFSFIHARDINGDGKLEFAGFVADVLADDYTNIAGLGVYDSQGKELWYTAGARTTDRPMHSDVAYQVGDITGEGRTQIIFTRDFEILLVDAVSGEVLRRSATPESVPGTEDRFPRIVGDSFHLCNLQGSKRGRDFLLKDRYSNLWAYSSDFELLWHRQLNTGHYPRAADINGDGRDEVMAGYSMLDADGRTMWTVPDSDPLRNRYPGPEHADGLWVGKFKEGPDAPIEIAMAASDLGFNLLDASGKLLARDLCGHAQALGIAKFRADLPGRQFLVMDFWGNPGIAVLLDCHGRRLCTRELDYWPAPVPVKWDHTGAALFYGSGEGSGQKGFLLDGYLNEVVSMPRGEGVRPSFMDVDGDGLDEFLFLNGREIQVWGPKEAVGDWHVQDSRTFENYNAYGGFYL